MRTETFNPLFSLSVFLNINWFEGRRVERLILVLKIKAYGMLEMCIDHIKVQQLTDPEDLHKQS